jgi:hypothetical protein
VTAPYIRVEPLAACAAVLGVVVGGTALVAGLAWRFLHVPHRRHVC